MTRIRLSYFLQETGEIRHALPTTALYPVPYPDRALMLRPGADLSAMITKDTYSIHFYGRRMRPRILEKEPDGIPRVRTLIGQLLKKHGIDPTLAPIPRKPGQSDTDDD